MPERRYKVAWADVAAGDLIRLISWIAAESPRDAETLLARLRDRALTLSTAPQRGRVVPELSFFGIAVLREDIVRPYRIVFRIEGRTVWILGVFDARRELEDVLLERLTAPPEN